ncbi:MAG: DUF192 domain-containing protein [Planctomycetes bacterium]|nr:DUF192 domain-containing protein [Planctomycetota bacterium]
MSTTPPLNRRLSGPRLAFLVAAVTCLAIVGCTRQPEGNDSLPPDYTVTVTVGGKKFQALPLFSALEIGGGDLKTLSHYEARDAHLGAEGRLWVGVFPRAEVQRIGAFRGTRGVLDLIFVGADGTVVSVVRQPDLRARPSEWSRLRFDSGGPAKFVLIAPAEWSEKEKVKPGTVAQVSPAVARMRVTHFLPPPNASEFLNLEVLDAAAFSERALANLTARGEDLPYVCAVQDNFGRLLVRDENEAFPRLSTPPEGVEKEVELWFVVKGLPPAGAPKKPAKRQAGEDEDEPGEADLVWIWSRVIHVKRETTADEIASRVPSDWRACVLLEKGAGARYDIQPAQRGTFRAFWPILRHARVRRSLPVNGGSSIEKASLVIARTEEERLAAVGEHPSEGSDGALLVLTKEANRAVRVADMTFEMLNAPASMAFVEAGGRIVAIRDVTVEPYADAAEVRGASGGWAPWAWRRKRLASFSPGSRDVDRYAKYDSEGKAVRFIMLMPKGWFAARGLGADGSASLDLAGLEVKPEDIEPME